MTREEAEALLDEFADEAESGTRVGSPAEREDHLRTMAALRAKILAAMGFRSEHPSTEE